MKNFDPIGYTRQKWSDPKHIKNKPHSCDKSHSFCNIEYEWSTDSGKMRPINRPVTSALPNVDLPLSHQKVISVNYDSITQQNLDDWVAQSMNRSLASILNPQKKFFIPPAYQQQLKQRYRKNKDLKKQPEDETYFSSNRNQKKTKGYLNNERRKKVNINDLCFDYTKLQPHQQMVGTPIKIRQMKKVQKKQVRRRNAILLTNDIHYNRFLRENKIEKEKDESFNSPEERSPIVAGNKIYSYNLESMSRTSCFENVPNSLIERQFDRIKDPQKDLLTSQRQLMNTQEQLHEKYRLLMNEKTNNAISHIKQMTDPTKQQSTGYTAQTATKSLFRKQMNSILQRNTHGQPGGQSQIKDKKYLQNKVIKLLNDMQVQSQSINEQMANLNIHVNQIFLQHPDARPQTKWILKAQEKIKANKNLLAIDCYKQAIILQPQLFIPVFNIAVLLEKQNMFESARLWFNLAKQFQTDSENVLFGISLVAIKQLRYSESLASINELINKIQSSGKTVQSVYYYIRALSNKQLGNHKEAKQDYNAIVKQMKPTNYNVLPNFIFSVVYGRQRRIHLQFNCLSYMLFRQAIFLILYESQKKVKENQALVNIAEKLVQGNFFCRFAVSLVKKLLAISTYQEKEKGEIIFTSKTQTFIILNGIVSLKSHENDFIKPQMISVIDKGGIIGAGHLQHHISQKPNSWFMVESKVELIRVPREDFQLFWKGQITFQMDFKYNLLKNVDLFKNLSECTLFKLCQLFEKRTFSRGQILYNDCSYRIQLISKPGRGYGLAKTSQKTDIRFINSGGIQMSSKQSKMSQRRQNSKFMQLINKHLFKFNEMKFNRTKFPGLFIVVKGSVELEDDRGFRCNGMISQRDFFGEGLFIDSDGYHNYGRMVAESQQTEILLLSLDKIVWLFSKQDKNIMQKNCKGRQTVQTIRFLRNRFMECQNVKLHYKFKK